MNKPVALSTQARSIAPASQATHIEQQRAVAQVQGALIVAQQRPRDEIAARARMEAACQTQALAEHAFFRYSRGGGQITGPSIHLAAEVARCWGNVDYGISELRRDDLKGESEMLAYAWDLETNNRVTNSFIVPHRRDKKGGPEALIDMRDIYENNANMGARRLRECIFRVLPTSLKEEAKSICIATLEQGGGEPIEARRTKLLEAFAELGVNRKQIEAKIGRAADRITAYDIGALRVIYQSIKRGEMTVGEEFPDDRAGEMTRSLEAKAQGTAKKPSATKPDANPAEKPSAPEPADEEETRATDWPEWSKAFIEEVETCETVAHVQDLLKQRREDLEGMRQQAPAVYEVTNNAAQAKMAKLRGPK